MDAVMFELKAAHLAVQGVGRTLLGELRELRMTPARFDLMNALGDKGMRQCDLWKQLGVVRSVVSEMVRELGSIGWVKRVRAADGRTWLVMLTRRGREAFRGASAKCVDNGEMTLHMDAGLAGGHVELDSLKLRTELIFQFRAIQSMYRFARPMRPDLYPWHPEDYWFLLGDPDDPTDTANIPRVDPRAIEPS